MSEKVEQVSIEKIVVPEWRVRKEAKDRQSLEELKTSINTHGLMQPIEVAPREDGSYELIFGLRRLEAVKELGWKTIPAVVRQRSEIERQMAEVAENVHRLPYGSKEKALAIAKYAKLAAILQLRTGKPILMTAEKIQRAKELRSQGIGLRKIARELGVSHETVRQYLKVHEGAPEAGVVREKTTVKQVSEFGHLLDTGQTMGEQIPKVGEAQPVEKKPYFLGERGIARTFAISPDTVSRSLEVERAIERHPCLDRLSRVEDVLDLDDLAPNSAKTATYPTQHI